MVAHRAIVVQELEFLIGKTKEAAANIVTGGDKNSVTANDGRGGVGAKR